MAFKIVISTTLVWLLSLQITSSQFNVAEGVKVTALTNVSGTVAVGQPFTLNCRVTDFVPGKEEFEIFFFHNLTDEFFANIFNIGGKAHFYDDLSRDNGSNRQYIAQVRPLVHRFPIYEVSITPKKAFTAQFYCNAFSVFENETVKFNVNSNHVAVSAVAPDHSTTATTTTTTKTTVAPSHQVPKMIASTNISGTVKVGQPFTFRCQMTDYVPGNGRFEVFFFQNLTSVYFFANYYNHDGKVDFHDHLNDHNTTNKQFIAKLSPLEHRFPVYEVSITPAKAFTAEFYCNGFHMEGGRILFDVDSNRVHVSVTA